MATSWTRMHQRSRQPHLPPIRCMMATTTTSFHGCQRSHVWWLIANGKTICTASRASTYCCPLPTNWCVNDTLYVLACVLSNFSLSMCYILFGYIKPVISLSLFLSLILGKAAQTGTVNADSEEL